MIYLLTVVDNVNDSIRTTICPETISKEPPNYDVLVKSYKLRHEPRDCTITTEPVFANGDTRAQVGHKTKISDVKTGEVLVQIQLESKWDYKAEYVGE